MESAARALRIEAEEAALDDAWGVDDLEHRKLEYERYIAGAAWSSTAGELGGLGDEYGIHSALQVMPGFITVVW